MIKLIPHKGYRIKYKQYNERGGHKVVTQNVQVLEGRSIFGDLVLNLRPWNAGGTAYLKTEDVLEAVEIPVPEQR